MKYVRALTLFALAVPLMFASAWTVSILAPRMSALPQDPMDAYGLGQVIGGTLVFLFMPTLAGLALKGAFRQLRHGRPPKSSSLLRKMPPRPGTS